MATIDQKNNLGADHRLAGHPEPGRLEAHHEDARLAAHEEPAAAAAVPPVTADVDATPKYIQYGAAVILGLAVGVGCYVWANGGVPSAPQRPGHVMMAPTEAYFAQAGAYDNPAIQGVLPDPFRSPFETTLDADEYVATLPEVTAYAAGGVAEAAPTVTEIVAVAPTTSKLVYLFRTDSSRVPETPELTAMAEQARENGLTLDVRAYTDEHGRVAYNQKLSERRARAIGDYLIAHGVPASKVSVHGMGPTHAFANDAQDRRAEVVVVR